MTPLTLTPEHKAKLLEMAKALFPEYVKWQWARKNQIASATDKYAYFERQDYLVNENQDNIYGNCIHWFEFCLTWLSHKILYMATLPLGYCKDLHSGLLQSTMCVFYGENHASAIHPVDYLYERFKRLLK